MYSFDSKCQYIYSNVQFFAQKSSIVMLFLKEVCTAIAVALHYILLTDFALMLAEGIHLVRMVVIIFPSKSIIQWLLPACWGKHITTCTTITFRYKKYNCNSYSEKHISQRRY